MRILPSVVVAVAVMAAFSFAVCAQTGEAPASAPAAQEARPQTPADRAFEPIQRDLSNLHKSLVNKGGIAKEDHAIIQTLRDRAAAFSREFPDDVRGLKAEFLLSNWLNEKDTAESLLRRIVEKEPDNSAARMALARHLRLENRYPEALDVMKASPPDPVKSPSDAFIYADCLVAEHQFEQAVAVFDAIPVDMIESKQRQELVTMKEAAKEYIDLWKQEQEIRHSEEQADDLPRVMLVTERGPILLELFENQAPNTVANFISLTEQGFYDTSRFHRVLPNFMAQGGDPNSKPGATGVPGQGDPGYFIPDETDREDHRKHFTGTLAMAKTATPNSGGCQFYITVLPTPHLNGKHTVFGRVIEGLEAARNLKQDDQIKAMTVLRKRPHEYKPNTLPKAAPIAPPPPPTDPATPPADPSTPPPTDPEPSDALKPETPPASDPQTPPQ